MTHEEKEIKTLVIAAQKAEDREDRRVLVSIILTKLKPFRHALAKRFSGKGVEFDDIVQELDMKLIEAIYDYDETLDPSALRHVTAKTRNGVWNYYRKMMNYFDDNKRELSLSAEFGEYQYGSRWFYPLDQLEDTAWDEETIVQRLAVEEELAKLTPHQQRVLQMYFIEDRTQYDVAEELSITQANVSRAKNRAISQLRTALLPEDETTETPEQAD